MDVARLENAAGFTATAFGWWRQDVPADVCYRYWRDVHGVLAARIPGLYQYRQLHLAPMPPHSRHGVGGAAQDHAVEDQPNGIAQLLFVSENDRRRFGATPLVTKYIFEDERNLVRRNATLWSVGDNARTYVDRTGLAAPQGKATIPTWAICIQKPRGVDESAFRRQVTEGVTRFVATAEGILRLRLHLLDAYDESAWNSPGVAHHWHEDSQYRAWLELILDDDAALEPLVRELDDTRCAGPVHAFPVFARYTLVVDGRPTDVGLRGYPAVQVIEEAGARNQKNTDLLEAMYGDMVRGADTKR